MRCPRSLALFASLVLSAQGQAPSHLQAAAEFLGGTPVPSSAAARRLCTHPGWQQHAMEMDRAWTRLEQSRLSRLRAWSARECADLKRLPTVFYPFGGPDLVHVQAFYPWAETTLLVGLEPIGSIPDLERLDLGRDLGHLRRTLRTLFQSSFFITKDMERDLQHAQVGGVLPVLMVFLARGGMALRSVDLLALDEQGRPIPPEKGRPATLARIRYGVAGSTSDRSLYYARADLSNHGLHRDGRILAFARGLGPSHTYLKSASYLLHRPSFTTFKTYLLKESASVLQDDSGLPLKAFGPERWNIQLYGTYDKPIALFSRFAQEDLARQYQETTKVKALEFGLGYEHRGASSNLLLARPKS